MRYGIWALVALVVGAFGAHFLLEDRGYVLINFRGYVVEMSVPVLLLALVQLYAGVRLAVRLWRAPRQLGQAVARGRERRAGEKLARGLIHMTEGDWNRGERLLTAGLHGTDTKLVNYLMAARAAQAQGSAERRDEWLALARQSDDKAEPAVLLTQAELQLESGEPAAALATLRELETLKPDHPNGLALQAEVCLALGDKASLMALAPRLAKAKLPPERLTPLLARVLVAMRSHAAFDLAMLEQTWSALPTALQRQPALIEQRARLLSRLGNGAEAVKSLAAALKRNWDPALVAAFGEIEGADPLKQLKRAEDWLAEHSDDAVLLRTAAQLCMRNELWGKARSYLESSIAIAPEPASYSLYGELLDGLGEGDEAARAYHAGLRLVTPEVRQLPALAAPSSLVDAEGS